MRFDDLEAETHHSRKREPSNSWSHCVERRHIIDSSLLHETEGAVKLTVRRVRSARRSSGVDCTTADGGMMVTTMQPLLRPPLPAIVACCCCSQLEIADYKLPSLEYQNQGSGASQVDFWGAPKAGQNSGRRMRRGARNGSSQVCSGQGEQVTPTKRGTSTTTAVRNIGIDCHDHQEERANMLSLIRSSILDCSSSSAAADVLFNALHELRGEDANAGAKTVLTRSQNCNSTSASVCLPQIECFSEADISAAYLLVEMSSPTSTTRHSAHAVAAVEESAQQQLLSSIRVSDHHGRAASAPCTRPFRELSEPMGARSAGGSPRAIEDEAGGLVQERKASWEGEATYSSTGTPRPQRVELKTLGKKRIKPRKIERELGFGMNQEVVTSESKCDILDRPPKRRHYKSLRELLGVK